MEELRECPFYGGNNICPEVKSEHDMYIRACEQISAQKRLIDKLKNRLAEVERK